MQEQAGTGEGAVDGEVGEGHTGLRGLRRARPSAAIPPATTAGHFVVDPAIAAERAALEDDLTA